MKEIIEKEIKNKLSNSDITEEFINGIVVDIIHNNKVMLKYRESLKVLNSDLIEKISKSKARLAVTKSKEEAETITYLKKECKRLIEQNRRLMKRRHKKYSKRLSMQDRILRLWYNRKIGVFV